MGRQGPRAGLWLALSLAVALLSWSGTARADPLEFRLVRHQTPAELYSGQTVTVPVVIENAGDETWSEAAGDRLAYHWRDPTGTMLVLDGRRTRLTTLVPPGERVELAARLEVPREPGSYVLEWRMVRENVHWYPRPSEGEPSRIELTVAGEAFVWGIADLTVSPTRVLAGEEASLSARLFNQGAATWRESDRDFVAYHWWDGDGRLVEYEGMRTPFVEPIVPGEVRSVSARVRAPSLPGRYRVELEPVRDQVSWYGPPTRGTSLSSEIVVERGELAWGLLAEDTPRRMALGSAFDVRLWVANTGEVEWEAQDRLSYLWRDATGRVVAEGARSEPPQLVAPGQSVELVARLFTPPTEGEYWLAWEMVRENVRWYGASSVPAGAPVRVEVGPPKLAWSVVEMDPLPAVWVNDTFEVRVVLRNEGAETWNDAAGDHLSYHWLDAADDMVVFDGRRSRLPGAVAPGETVALQARIRGPRAAGDYQLRLEMVREEVQWYGPASDPAVTTHSATVRWFSGTLQVLLALTTAIGCVLGRRFAGRTGGGLALELVPVLWTWSALSLLGVTFAELSGLGFWTGGLRQTLSGAALAAFPLLLLPGRFRGFAVPAIVVPLSALALADLVYIDFYGSIVPVTALTAAHHLGEVSESIVALFQPAHGWLAPTPVAALLLAFAWPRASPPGVSPRARALIRGGALSVCLLATFPTLGRLYGMMTTELGVRVFSEEHNAARLGMLNAHLFDLARTVREAYGRQATAEDRARLEAWFERRASEVAAVEPPGAGVAKGKSLLLIQVESAQTFVVGARVNGQEITPFLNGLRGRALYYPELVDQTAQGKTSDGEYAVLASQHPLQAGALSFLRADNHFVTLAHVLAAQGYSTLSAHPFKRGFWNRAVLHPRYGFARSLFERELGPGPEIGWGLADGPFFERAVEELKRQARPFFAFLITLSLHHPYDEFPERFQTLDLGELQGTQLGNYLHGMNYFDRSLERLFEDLHAAGILEDTVVAIYGDHDARLDLGDDVLRLAGLTSWSPSVYHRLERVPLLVVLPGGGPHGTVATVGGQVDIAPTLLHYMGVARPRAFIGRPLTPGTTDGFAAYPDGSAFADDRFFVAQARDIPPEGACFDASEGTARARSDCDEIAGRAAEELIQSRALLDLDLHRALAEPPLLHFIEQSQVE